VRGYYGIGLMQISLAVEGDLEAARRCFLRAHHAGVASATYYLFLISAATSEARHRDVEAWAYLKEAVARGHVDATEKYGELNLESSSPIERAEALDLLTRVARTYQSPHALYLIGLEAAKKDHERAFRILSMAAEQGSGEAGLALGNALLNGHGCPMDLDEAALYIDEAVKSKVPGAMVALGRLCQKRGDVSGMVAAFQAALLAGKQLQDSERELCRSGATEPPLASGSE
jgi:TPR repeat protein